MSSELIIALIGIVSTIVSGWTSWFFTRKKYNSEVDNSVIANMKESLDFYKQLSDDNRERLEEVLRRNEQLEKEIQQLRTQVFELMTNLCYNMGCALREKEPRKNNQKKNKKNETESRKDIQGS